jgi:hypothetical protein
MALQLRRGTNTERQTITPAEGELVYTTDTKALYVGDGTTVGGNVITSSGGGGGGTSTAPELANYRLRRDIWDSFRYYPGTLEGGHNGYKTATGAGLEWGSTLVELQDHTYYENLPWQNKIQFFKDTLTDKFKVVFWQFFQDWAQYDINSGLWRTGEAALYWRLKAIKEQIDNDGPNVYHGPIGFQFEENTNNIGADSGSYGVFPATPRQYKTLFFHISGSPEITWEQGPYTTSPLFETAFSWQFAVKYTINLNPAPYINPNLVGSIAVQATTSNGHAWTGNSNLTTQGWLYTLNSLREISSTCRFTHFLFPQKLISGSYPSPGEIWLKNESFVGGELARHRDVYVLYINEEDTEGNIVEQSFLKDNFLSSGKEIVIQDDGETIDPLYNLVGTNDPPRSIVLDTLPYRNTYGGYNIQKFTPAGEPISFTGDQYVTDQISGGDFPWSTPNIYIDGNDLYVSFNYEIWPYYSSDTYNTILNNFPIGTSFAVKIKLYWDNSEDTYNGNNIIFPAVVTEHPYGNQSIFDGGYYFTFKFTQADLGETNRYTYGYDMWGNYYWSSNNLRWSFLKLGTPPPGYYKLWCTQATDKFLFEGGNIFNPIAFKNRQGTQQIGYSSNIDLVGTIFEQDTSTTFTSGNTYRVLDATGVTTLFHDISGFDYILDQPPYRYNATAALHKEAGASFTVINGSANKDGLITAKLRNTPGKIKLTTKLKDIIGPESIELNTSTALTYRYRPEPGSTYTPVISGLDVDALHNGNYGSYTWKGVYTPSYNYFTNDLIVYEGAYYIATQDNIFGTPPDARYYPNPDSYGWQAVGRFMPILPFSVQMADNDSDAVTSTFGNFYTHFVRYDENHNPANSSPWGPFDSNPGGYSWSQNEVISFYFSTVSYNGHNNADYIRILSKALYNKRVLSAVQGLEFMGGLLKLNQIVKPTRVAQVSDTKITAGSRQVIYRISHIEVFAGTTVGNNVTSNIPSNYFDQLGHFRVDIMPYNGINGISAIKRPVLLNWPGGKNDNSNSYLNANELGNTVFSIDIEIL